MQKDFVLILPLSEVSSMVDSDNVKRELYNAEPWISDFCKNKKLLTDQYLSITVVTLIEYFSQILKEEGKSIHDYASCKFGKIDRFIVEITFRGYRYE